MTEKATEFFLTPVGRRVLVRMDEYGYRGNIIIPEKYRSKTTTGIIVLMGTGDDTTDTRGLKVGDHVLFDRFSGSEIAFDRPDGQTETYRDLNFDEIKYRINDASIMKEKGGVEQ